MIKKITETIEKDQLICDDCGYPMTYHYCNNCEICHKDLCDSCRHWIIIEDSEHSDPVCTQCQGKIRKLNDKVDEARSKRLAEIKKLRDEYK